MANGNLPLLIKGYNTNLNGTGDTLPVVTTEVQWNNVFDSGRGDVMYIDAIETAQPQIYAADAGSVATISVSGVQVIVNANTSDFAPLAYPGNYFITPLRQPGGQTLQLYLNGNPNSKHGLQVLAFYQNQFDTPEIKQRLYTSKLKRRFQDSFFNVVSQAKYNQSGTFTAPVGNGYVIGVELIAYLQGASNNADLGLSTITMVVNGVNIFENVCSLYGHVSSTRPQIFPIKINPGDTYYFIADTLNCSATVDLSLGARLYFDDSNE